jgi:hypothetical protein
VTETGPTETTETTETTATTPTTQTTPTTAPTAATVSEPRSHRVRSVGAGVVGVIAVIALVLSVVAVWVRSTAMDGARVAGMVTDALALEEVESGLAEVITEQITAAVDVDSLVASISPGETPRLDSLLAAGLTTSLERGIAALLGTDEVQSIIHTLVEEAHSKVVDVLRGDGLRDGISISNGEVSLNLLPLVSRGLVRLQGFGLLSDVDVPVLAADGDPDEQRAELSEALGRNIPDGFGQLVVYRSDSLADAEESVQQAQRLFSIAARALTILLIVTALALAGSVLLAVERWRALLILGAGIAGALVLLRAATRLLIEHAPDVASRPGGRAAIESLVNDAGSSLLRLAGAVQILAVIVAAVGLWRRGWLRADLIAVAAIAIGAVTVGVVGLGAGGLLLGVVLAVAALLAGRHWLLPAEQPPASLAP